MHVHTHTHTERERQRQTDRQFSDLCCIIAVFDQGTPRMSSSASIIIVVLDVNDNPPQFERMMYAATVSEALPIGASVGSVYATSRDTGINAKISYSVIAGNEQDNFKINENTGKCCVHLCVLNYKLFVFSSSYSGGILMPTGAVFRWIVL